MKIVLLHKLESFMAPIGLLQIAAEAERDGHTTFYINLNNPDWLGQIDVINPQVVACSVMTGEAKHYYSAASIIKGQFPHILLIAGGAHPTFFPHMVKESSFDVICRGEGEQSFRVLLRGMADGAQLHDFKEIPNLVTLTTPDPYNIPMYPLEHHLGVLRPPLWEKVYDHTHLGANPLKSYMTGRGCPFSCGYCFNEGWRDLYSGQRSSGLRKFPVNYIIDDLLEIKQRWPLEYVKFYDDIFVTKADDWFYEFCRAYKRHIDKPFFVLMRAEHMTPGIARYLRDAGCKCISMSIEAKSEVRRLILNRTQSDEALIKAHEICRFFGISTFTNVIVGLPDTNTIDDLEALELAAKCKPTWIEYPIFEPYPKTELGERTFSKGYAKPDWREVHTSYQYRSRLNCFPDRVKDIQVNFGTLGVIATLFPRFREWIVSDLIFRKPHRVFLLWYFVVKMMRMQKKIYPTGINLWGRLGIYYKSLKQELWRHSEE